MNFLDVYTCRKCSDLNYFTPHAFWNIRDFGAKCQRYGTINNITMMMGELKKQIICLFWVDFVKTMQIENFLPFSLPN